MNGWARTPEGRAWHQVEFDGKTHLATLQCNGTPFRIDPALVMDYRFVPPPSERCGHDQCQMEVQP